MGQLITDLSAYRNQKKLSDDNRQLELVIVKQMLADFIFKLNDLPAYNRDTDIARVIAETIVELSARVTELDNM